MKTTSLSLTLLALSLSATTLADPLVIAHRGTYLSTHCQ